MDYKSGVRASNMELLPLTLHSFLQEALIWKEKIESVIDQGCLDELANISPEAVVAKAGDPLAPSSARIKVHPNEEIFDFSYLDVNVRGDRESVPDMQPNHISLPSHANRLRKRGMSK
nr:hypothetical protein [Tanacetum cinerariifolium]